MNESDINLLKSLIQSREKEDSEFEIRFKRFINEDDCKYIVTKILGKRLKGYELEKSTIYDGGFRKLESNGKVRYEKKQRVMYRDRRKVDVVRYFQKQYNMTISESEETEIPKSIFLSKYNQNTLRRMYKMTRSKYRARYKEDGMNVDITYVEENKQFELEIEILKVNGEKVLNDIIKTIIGILLHITKSNYVLSNNEKEWVMSNIRKIMRLRESSVIYFPGALPYAMKKNELHRIRCGYAVADKTDGQRMLLVCLSGRGYGVRRPKSTINESEISYICPVNAKYSGTILDGEYMMDERSRKFYGFDMLFDRGNDVREMDYKTRYSKIFEEGDIKKKSVMFNKEISPDKYLNDISKRGYQTDGIIFTPIHQPYKNDKILKWKQNNTVDFYVNVQSDGRWKLMIAGTDSNGNNIRHYPFGGVDGKGTFYITRRGGVVERLKNDLLPQSGIVDVSNFRVIVNEFVCEFEWNKSTWKPIKIRYDKIYGNNCSVVNDAWNAIQEPIKLSDIKNELNYNCIRRYHNDVKREIIKKYSKGKNVLNIGSGAGGDIKKYENAGIEGLTGINIVNVEYPYNSSKMKFIKSSVPKYNISTLTNGKKYDLIFSFFSLHYFFENNESKHGFFLNISKSIKTKGKFIAVFMNGESVKKIINKRYNTFMIKKNGDGINVSVKGTKYFNKSSSKEYLVDINELKSIGKKFKFKHILTEPLSKYKELDSYKNLSEEERLFSSLFVVCVFEYE